MLSVFVATTNNDEKDSCLRAILICVMGLRFEVPFM